MSTLSCRHSLVVLSLLLLWLCLHLHSASATKLSLARPKRYKRPNSKAIYGEVQPTFEWGPDCIGEIEISRQQSYRRLNNGRTAASYPDLQTLCAAAQWGGDPESNLGGVCVAVHGYIEAGVFVAGPPYGDEDISDDAHLRRICLQHCECEFPVAWTPKWYLDAVQASENNGVKPRFGPIPGEIITGPNDFMFVNKDGSVAGETRKCQTGGNERCVDAEFSGEGLCHGECNDYSCRSSGIGGCACLAQNRDPLTGLFTAVGCSVPLLLMQRARGRLNGRSIEDEVGCPCNGSYVSTLCCSSESKMVWEGPEMKLGELSIGL